MNLLIKTSLVVATITAISVFAVVDSTSSAPATAAVVDSTGSAPAAAAVVDTTVTTAVVDSSKSAEKVFTIEELAAFNGKDGKSAYMAIDGVVYDVTSVKAWKKGVHHGVKAGTDGSKKIQSSPHGKKVLTKLPVVGKLAQK